MQVSLWLNAFIPGSVAGYTQRIVSGTHAGKTAIPLPAAARLNPFNTFKTLGAGYLTDQRDFSDDVDASVRMQSLMNLSIAHGVSVQSSRHRSSGTTEVNIATGAQIAFDTATMSRCAFGPLRAQAAVASSGFARLPFSPAFRVNRPAFQAAETYVFTVVAAASDPLVSASADIDYRGTFEVTVVSRSPYRVFVAFDGLVDAFPAFECYAALGVVKKPLFRLQPPVGNTVVDLLGGPSQAVTAQVSIP